MNKTFNVLFILRKPKNYLTGDVPVYMRLTIDGTRAEFAAKRKVDPKIWNYQAGRVKGKTEEAKTLNHYLDLLQSKVFEAERELLKAGQPVTVTTIGDKLNNKETVTREKMLLEVYQYHNDQFAELVNAEECALGTLKKFKSAYTSLASFIKWKYGSEDYPIAKLTHQFITDYEFYLKTVQKVQHNSAMGNIKKLKKIVRLCVANDWLDKNPFIAYKITSRETHRNFLTSDELTLIVQKDFINKRLSQVRDMFIFSCYTGLSYTDVIKLRPASMVKGIDDEIWIYTTRTKTDTDSKIPLLPLAQQLVEKYKSNPKAVANGTLFPSISNQRMNSYLKEIADCCNINKELTFHCARHTFATTITLTNGVPIETVGKMLGHKNIRTTQLYAKIIDRKVSEDMQILKHKLGQCGPMLEKVAN